ncbi:MAG: type II toxin-antitoxin system VapC family toxin [Fibrobacteres bacterium]|nr:type II toxin-antitoxin system VapC family toxin [Fibrobacterota bacterium]
MLDTCALIWYSLLDKELLSRKAAQKIEEASEIMISSISIWEIGIKVKKKDLILPISIDSYVNRLKQMDTFKIIPLEEDIIIRSLNLDWDHKDPADRFIVATAQKYGIPLLTADKLIRSFYSQAVW